MLAVARPPSAEMLDADPSLRRTARWAEWLKYPVIACLALVAAGIALTAIFSNSWLALLLGAGVAWLLFARLSVAAWRNLHLNDYAWRLDQASPRERTILMLARKAVWPWSKEVPDDATHAVLVAEEIGGELEVEDFVGFDAAKQRITRRVDVLAGERKPIVVALVELDAEPEQAVIEVSAGTLQPRRSLDSLPDAEDGWLVGV